MCPAPGRLAAWRAWTGPATSEAIARHRYLPGIASCACNRDGFLGRIRTEDQYAEHLAKAIATGFEVYIRKANRNDPERTTA